MVEPKLYITITLSTRRGSHVNEKYLNILAFKYDLCLYLWHFLSTNIFECLFGKYVSSKLIRIFIG